MNADASLRSRSHVLDAIARHAMHRPDQVALESPSLRLSYAQLQVAVDALAHELTANGARTVALLTDNGPAWALVDLAAVAADLCLVPLAPFFSKRQLAHALESAGVDTVIADPALAATLGLDASHARAVTSLPAAATPLVRWTRHAGAATVPPGTRKITYTSGTTGEPKGVCLSQASMEAVAESLGDASGAAPGDRHLAALPLATLLENVGGVYAPLIAGATCCLLPMQEVGLQGASQFDPWRLLQKLRETGAQTTILVPQMLQAVVEALAAGQSVPKTLRFVAVGGASVAPRLLALARRHGLPVFEGYGLSECASVVALNRPGAQRDGSVGRPLPHLRVRIADDGEVEVSGNRFLGYVGETPPAADAWLRTGDLGELDADGFLYLSGRKKNMFVTAFGRNVSPEWVERELCLHPAIVQAAVFGEARPWNVALIVPRPGSDAAAIEAAIRSTNRELPDYARISRWLVAAEPFTPANDQLTTNGRLRRVRIREVYGASLDSLYAEGKSA